MQMDGSKLKEIKIRLLLSSRAEMQKVIEQARSQTALAFQTTLPLTQPMPAMNVAPVLIQPSQQQMQQPTMMHPSITATNGVNESSSKPADGRKEKKDRRRRSRSRDRDRSRRSRD